MRRAGVCSFVLCLIFPISLSSIAQVFPPECPHRGTLEIVKAPEFWADRCFMAVNGHDPDPSHPGEVESLWRDLDLDGELERLEVRGTGNAAKQIYVFKSTPGGYVYMGELIAHPAFTVSMEDGEPTISYVHRFGADDLRLIKLRYREHEFVQISSEPVH